MQQNYSAEDILKLGQDLIGVMIARLRLKHHGILTFGKPKI